MKLSSKQLSHKTVINETQTEPHRLVLVGSYPVKKRTIQNILKFLLSGSSDESIIEQKVIYLPTLTR